MVIRGEKLDRDYFADGTPELTEHQASYGVEAIAHALLNIYHENVDVDSDLEENLFQETRRLFDEAVSEGYAEASQKDVPLPDETFREAFLHSADVFSAFRVHKMQNDIAAQMLDEKGHVKPFRQFVKDVSPYIEHRNRAWLKTEYDTAILRAQNAAEWQQFQDEKDVYPNLEWIQSTSPNPGADHMVFWGTVLPVDDPFWDEHKPGDRWNCKCELRQTDRGATPVPVSDGKSDAAPGLESNPAKAKEVFSDSHPYYPDSCSACPFAGGKLMALAHDLVSGKDCHHCRRVNKCIERSERRIAKKERLEALNPETNHKEFKAAQRDMVAELRRHGELERDSRKLYTGHLFFGRREFKRIKEHCFTGMELETARHLHTLIPKLSNGRYIPIDMSRKNYRLKIQEGVLNYVAYDVEYKGDLYVLKCQVRRHGHNVCEYPYSIKRKE